MSFFSEVASAVAGVSGVIAIAQSENGAIMITGATAPALIVPPLPASRASPARAAKPKGKPAASPVKRGRPPKSADTNTTVPAPATNASGMKLSDFVLSILPTGEPITLAELKEAIAKAGYEVKPNHLGIALSRHHAKGRAFLSPDGGWSRPIAAEAEREAA